MFCYLSSNLVFISLINNKRIHCLLYWDVFLAILEAFILKIFRGAPPDPPRTLAHAARAKNACGILLRTPPPPPPHRKNAARSLKKCVFWTFWYFLGWISAKLALIWSKMRFTTQQLAFLATGIAFYHIVTRACAEIIKKAHKQQ